MPMLTIILTLLNGISFDADSSSTKAGSSSSSIVGCGVEVDLARS
jgi:hypothetical protein